MSCWPVVAAVTSFVAIVGWLALAVFVDESVPASAIGLYYAHAIGMAAPAVIVPALLTLFARPKWAVTLVGGMWLMFGFMLLGQHSGRIAALNEHYERGATALTAEEQHLPFTDTRRMQGMVNATAGFLLVYCQFSVGVNNELFGKELRAAAHPELPDTYAIASAAYAAGSDPSFDRNARCPGT